MIARLIVVESGFKNPLPKSTGDTRLHLGVFSYLSHLMKIPPSGHTASSHGLKLPLRAQGHLPLLPPRWDAVSSSGGSSFPASILPRAGPAAPWGSMSVSEQPGNHRGLPTMTLVQTRSQRVPGVYATTQTKPFPERIGPQVQREAKDSISPLSAVLVFHHCRLNCTT